MLVVGLGTSIVPLDTAVNIAFPAITASLGRPIGDIQWIVSCYVLTYAGLMLALGRLGDLFGHARVFRIGLAWSVVAYLLCGLAPSFAALLFCRFLQGIGASLVLSCGIALATGLYGEERRSRVLGVYTAMFAVGATLGPWIGGALVENWGWPAVFWFRAPIAAASLLLLRGFPGSPRKGGGDAFDLLGALLLALGLAALLLALSRRGDLLAIPLALAGLAALAGFVRHEVRIASPIIDLRVFRLPGFALVNLANVLTHLGGFTAWLLVPYYLVRATGFTLTGSGALLATASAGAIVASSAGGRLIGALPAERLALAGALMVGLGLVLTGTWSEATPVALLVAALGVQGLGLGLFQVAYTDIVTAAIPRAHRGVAGSLALMTRTIGTVGATAFAVLVFESLEPGEGFLAAFRHTFLCASVLPFAMAALLAHDRRR